MQDLSDVTLLAATLSVSPSGESDQTMYCTDCGTKNSEDANFCKQCGHKLVKTGPLKISEEEFALPPSKDDQFRDLLLVAFRKYEEDDLDGAVTACGVALELKPESTDARSLLSTLYEKQGQTAKAISEREKVLALNPGSIADREKLDLLRDNRSLVVPKRITSSHRAPRASMFDNPAGAAAAAVVVMLVVLMVGAWAVWSSRTKNAEAKTLPAGQQQMAFNQPNQQGLPQSPAQNWVQNPQTTAQSNPAVSSDQQRQTAPQPGAVYFPPNIQPYQQPQSSPRQTRREQNQNSFVSSGGRTIPPMNVRPPGEDVSNAGPEVSTIARGSESTGTVHLPDNPGIQMNPATANQTDPGSSRPRGKVEIIVSPAGNDVKTSGAGRTGQGGDGNNANFDSREQRTVALRYQSEGNYRQALTSWIKALDGAGDDAAFIHQQVGFCHQKLGDSESAIAQYKAAIAAYNEQIKAGRSVEAAKRGLRASEAGIKACQ